MPKTTKRVARRRNRRGEETRATILTAARRLLKERGVDGLSIDAVARAAGVTRSSIYHQFHSRDEFLLHLIAETLRGLQRSRVPAGRSVGALDRFFAEAEAGFRADPHLLRMFYQLVFGQGPGMPAELRRLLQDAYRFRTERLADGLVRDGTCRTQKEAETLAVLLVATLDGLYARRLVDLPAGRVRDSLRAAEGLVTERRRVRKRRTGQR